MSDRTIADLPARLRDLRLIGFDIDGVFTDGRFYLSDDGVESKAFDTQDGYGIRRLLDDGIVVAVISGRKSAAVEKRMAELGVQHVFVGCSDKAGRFSALLDDLGIDVRHSAYVGDDVPDLPVLQMAGTAVGVANAHADVRPACDWITEHAGGRGAVREICDAILAARGVRTPES